MHLSSLLSRSSSSLLQHLSRVKHDPNAALLFALSANAPNLGDILSRLRLLARHSLGCLSAPLPGAPEVVICSLATFALQDCVPFRSEIRGRAPIQVGRWNRTVMVAPESEKVEKQGFAYDFSTWKDAAGASVRDPRLPSELMGQSDINALLFLSDNAPEGLLQSLAHLPDAEKLGVIASSTPFITGRPFTLFQDDRIYSSGAVGIGLRHPPRPSPAVTFHGLIPLSAPMRISKSEGNLVHELNQSNPAKMLIDAIAADARMSRNKDENFFLGHLFSDSSSAQQVRRVYRVLSGGPSRGSIALEADNAPDEGEVVQFFCQAPSSPSVALKSLSSYSQDESTLHFLSFAEDHTTPSPEQNVGNGQEVQIIRNTFLAASENGFLCTEGKSSRPMWKCSVPGAVGSWTWAGG